MRSFWPLHADNPINYDANFALNSNDRFHCNQQSDTSKLFHALLILRFCDLRFAIERFFLVLVADVCVCECLWINEGEIYE